MRPEQPTVVEFATPPERTYTQLLEFTVVEFASPPEKTLKPPWTFKIVEFATPPKETIRRPLLFTVVEFAVVPECRVAEVLDNTNPLKLLATKVALAPSAILTNPPFSRIAVATPPEETYMLPQLFTVVEFASPPEETYI